MGMVFACNVLLVCLNAMFIMLFHRNILLYVTVSGKRVLPRKMYIRVISDYRYRVQLCRIAGKHT